MKNRNQDNLYLGFYTGVGRRGVYIKAASLAEARQKLERQPFIRGERVLSVWPMRERSIYSWPTLL